MAVEARGDVAMTTANPAALVLIDRASDDELVVRQAAALTGSTSTPIALLHVAPLPEHSRPRGAPMHPRIEPWEQIATTERAALEHLRELAARHLGHRPVQVLVRFGDVPEEVARVAECTRAALVVAASRPAHGFLGHSRDEQLVAAVERPVALVTPRAQARVRRRAIQPLTA